MHYTPAYLDVGFDTMILSEQDGPGRYDDDYHRHLMEQGLADCIDLQDQEGAYRAKAPRDYFKTFGVDPTNLPDQEYSTEWIGDRACEQLARWNKEGGNLLMVGFIKPHHPHDVPDRWSKLYDPATLSLLPGWTDSCTPVDRSFSKGFFDYTSLDESKYRAVLAKYYGSITEIDHHVGRMVSILKEKGIYDDCLLVFTSDHGEYMGFHHLLLKGNYMYDPLVRIPLVVKFPGNERKGSTVSKLVNTINITGTILETGECVIPQELWHSVRPLLDEEPCTTVFAEDDRSNYIVRTPTRKLLLSRDKRSQYFDLIKDPLEMQNAFDDPANTHDIDGLKERLFDWLAYESRTQVHVDHGAPVRPPTSGPPRDEAHSASMRNYFKEQMERWQK